MVSTIKAEKLTKVISNIEPRRAVLSDRVEVWLTSSKFTSIYKATLSEEYELIEECDNVATRLVDCKDDSAMIVARK
jgi:hypothetical protein